MVTFGHVGSKSPADKCYKIADLNSQTKNTFARSDFIPSSKIET